VNDAVSLAPSAFFIAMNSSLTAALTESSMVEAAGLAI
jgi:hypothetical protein